MQCKKESDPCPVSSRFPSSNSLRQMKMLYHDNVLQAVENIAKAVTLTGLVAVLVAAVGIVGLVSFSISQRLKEIAIRMALGPGRVQLLNAVLQQFLRPVAIGLLGGIAIAASLSKLLRVALYGVSNLDPASYAAAILVLTAILLLAAILPARHAWHLNLAKTLHNEGVGQYWCKSRRMQNASDPIVLAECLRHICCHTPPSRPLVRSYVVYQTRTRCHASNA